MSFVHLWTLNQFTLIRNQSELYLQLGQLDSGASQWRNTLAFRHIAPNDEKLMHRTLQCLCNFTPG
jgi:hypothetical protein